MMKTILVLLLIGLSLVGLRSQAQTTWVCPPEVEFQSLRVLNWSTYIADDTIPNFEAICGVTVEYFEYGSSEEALELVRTAETPYDVLVVDESTTARLAQEGFLQALQKDLIPNLAHLSPSLLNLEHDPENTYSLPYQWGTVGIAYDTLVVSEALESWADFLAYEGTIALQDDPREMLGLALLLAGYSPNSTDPFEIQAGADFLMQNIQAAEVIIAPDSGQDLLMSGDVAVIAEYSGDILQIIEECACEDFRFILPSDGFSVWVDSMVVGSNARHPELAHAFIDYLLDGQVGADLSAYTAYATPNLAALDLLPQDMRDNSAIYPTDELLAVSFSTTFVGAAEPFYEAAWDQVKAHFNAN